MTSRHSSYPRYPLLGALAFAISLGSSIVGCGPEVVVPEEKPPIIPHRIAGCSMWCGAKFECGNGANGTIAFDTEEECVDYCTRPNAMAGYGYQGDGVDACIVEFETLATCINELSCDAIQFYFDTELEIQQRDRPCWNELETTLACSAKHPYPGD